MYTTHLHALSDAESQEVLTLLDPVNESSTTTSGDTPQDSAPVDTTHTTLANSGLGARTEDDTAVAMEDEIMTQGEEGEHSMMTGRGEAQYTTGASQEMTQSGPDIALAEEATLDPSVSPHDMSANNLANSSLGARAEDDTVVAMEDEIMSQGEDGEQSSMAGGGAGLHTTGASKTSGAISSGGSVPSTRTSQDSSYHRSSGSESKEVPHYRAEHGRTNVNAGTSTLGTLAAAATQTTSQSAGCKRPSPDRPLQCVGLSRAVVVLMAPTRAFSRGTNQKIQWLPTTISIKCG